MRARFCSQSSFLNVFSAESYFWLKAHHYVYCLQRLTRPPQVWKKVEGKSCISWTNILSNPMKLWCLAFVVVHHHHYHDQPHHHQHHRQHSPPLASSPGGAQSDKVLSSASMSTRVAPRDHVNSPALFIIRNGMWALCWVQQNNNIFSERFYKNLKVRSIGNDNRTTRIPSRSFFLSPISLKMLEISLQSNRSWSRKIYQKTSSKDDPKKIFG